MRSPRAVVEGVRAAAFWSTVPLSLAYLPVLSGTVVEPRLETVLGLLAVHVLSLVVGRKHAVHRE